MHPQHPRGTLTVRGVSKSYGPQTILDEVSLVVSPGDRIGVVGPNGVGKTTLLRLLAGEEHPDSGVVRRDPPSLLVGHLPQESDALSGETLRSYLARRTGVAAAEARLDAVTEAMASDPDRADEYTEALDAFLALGGDDLEARAAAVCEELGLGGGRLDQPTETFSGGEASRAALASILLARFDVFLLDEPTNDLDLEGLERLEDFVAGLRAGVVIVSHDRAFLERTISDVLELDEWTRTAVTYGGGYQAYLDHRETARRNAYAAYDRYTDQRSDLADRAQRMKAWSDKGVGKAKRAKRSGDEPDKHIKTARVASSEKQASKIKQIEKRMERLEREAVAKPYEPWELRLSLAPVKRAGHMVARLDRAVVDRGSFRLGPLSLEVTWGERVRVGGPNGSGKSTMIQALLGRIPLSAGERYLGPGVVVGELDQRRGRFDGAGDLIDAFVEAAGVATEEARTLLAKFGLGADDVVRPAGSLSPGERTRANLALLQATGVNLLVLDEPTNHLDLPAIEQLEAALEGYTGTLLLVTHDRRFAEHVRTTRTIELDAGPVG